MDFFQRMSLSHPEIPRPKKLTVIITDTKIGHTQILRFCVRQIRARNLFSQKTVFIAKYCELCQHSKYC